MVITNSCTTGRGMMCFKNQSVPLSYRVRIRKYQRCPAKTLKKIRARVIYRLNQWYQSKENSRICHPSYFHGVKGPIATILVQQQWRLLEVQNFIYVCVNAVDTRVFDLCSDSDDQWGVVQKMTTRRTRQLSCVVAVGRLWRPRQLHPCARRRMTAQARMALQQRPQPPVHDSKAIHGWPCMLAQTL